VVRDPRARDHDPRRRHSHIEGRYRVTFRIDGDTVTFHLLGRGASDPFFVAAWETAPFIRTT
jgi:hypothetical protein